MVLAMHPARMATLTGWPQPRNPFALAIAIAMHAAAAAGFAQLDGIDTREPPKTRIVVSLIAPAAPATHPPVTPPKPLPARRDFAPPQVPVQTIAQPPMAPAAAATPAATAVAPPKIPRAQAASAANNTASTPQSVAVAPPRYEADYLRNPAPPYPSLARRMGEQGRVVLRVLVTAAGDPEKVELRTGSGSPRLDQSALDTVRRWKFVPARQGDQPVAAWVQIPIVFFLES